MNRIGMIRTTAFKLAIVYLLAFTGLTAFLIGYISYNTNALLDRQLDATITAEINSLTEQYRRGGIRQLVSSVELRSRRPGASLYLVNDFSGRSIVGNVAGLLPGSAMDIPDGQPVHVTYYRLDGDQALEYDAIVRIYALPGGFRMLVGRDIAEREEFNRVIRDAAQFSVLVMVALGLATWIFVSRAVLKRVENVAATSRHIMSGDLSRRLEVTGSGDEFDDLANSLNEMLARIEALMIGLKEVSDDIAHDLKTPLNRLRTRLEATLRGPADATVYRDAIAASIGEADQLIQVFDALLRIARMEAGSSGDEMVPLDAAEIVEDLADLYEPVVEDAGGVLRKAVDGPLPIAGNRTLISQALANLIDNAIKYGLPAGEDAPGGEQRPVTIKGLREGDEIRLCVADSGPGIPEADHARALQRFVRLEQSRTLPGSGLGLSLVSAIARLHGGRLVLADAKPGLEVTLILPARANEKKAVEDAHDRGERPAG
nr:ATP-binding protein [Chthonobacter albigriseus]